MAVVSERIMPLFSVQVIIDTEQSVWLVCAVICLLQCRRGQSASFGQMSCIMISKEGWLRKREVMHRKTECENLSTVVCVGFGATFFSWWHHMSSDDVDIMCVCGLFLTELKSLELNYKSLSMEREEQVVSYYRIRQQLDGLSKDLLSFIQKPQYILPFLQPGRLVKVSPVTFLLLILLFFVL